MLVKLVIRKRGGKYVVERTYQEDCGNSTPSMRNTVQAQVFANRLNIRACVQNSQHALMQSPATQ